MAAVPADVEAPFAGLSSGDRRAGGQAADAGELPSRHGHLLLQHTSASLTLNENCDPGVRSDMEAHLHRLAPEDAPYYRHTYEGPDDMPAHIKSSLLGVSLLLPIRDGQLALGTWQGIWLGEHRVDGGARKVLVTLQGE
ncbi:secondary thiamine-phosphate synthase enzyme YjbQ [Aeromonas allosaccharophila]|uniref:secondary thiamine-phosphate synthase enzyme YjbQ n=1 Tax=Aeromonas allosaccharophila TaxID=656 RepID=UPI003D250E05